MYTYKELEKISRSCLLVCALLDFAKARARAAGALDELKFLGEGRDRFLLDFLHARHIQDLEHFRHQRIIEEAVLCLADKFSHEYGQGQAGFWTGLGADFGLEYSSGRLDLLEVNWE
jgi:hypothetical protein